MARIPLGGADAQSSHRREFPRMEEGGGVNLGRRRKWWGSAIYRRILEDGEIRLMGRGGCMFRNGEIEKIRIN